MTTTALLRFPVTQAIYNTWNTDYPDFFDLLNPSPFSAHLLVYLFPEDYKPVRQELGETDLAVGFSSVLTPASRYLYGFDITTREAVAAVYASLKQLGRNAIASSGLYTPISVYDAHNIEHDEATATFDGITYTQRSMRLMELKPTSGALRDGANIYRFGFSFRMLEVEPRSV